MYYIIYKITNKIDGKFYVGSHKTKNLDDRYMGSGKYLKYAQLKYGIENFVKEILFVFDNPVEMYSKEAEIVTEDFISLENTYNLKIGGYGGFDYLNDPEKFKNPTHSTEHSKKMTARRLEVYDNLERSNWSKKGVAVQREKSLGFFNPFFNRGSFLGLKHTDDTKRKIGEKNSIAQQGIKNSQYNTVWITNDIINRKVKKNESIPPGFRLGRVFKSKLLR